jgi:hypothetical protein
MEYLVDYYGFNTLGELIKIKYWMKKHLIKTILIETWSQRE